MLKENLTEYNIIESQGSFLTSGLYILTKYPVEKTEEITNNSSPQAKPKREFKIGTKELWKFCKKNYDEKKAKTIPEYDKKNMKKKNTPSILVKKIK
jgi:hypothetical protein